MTTAFAPSTTPTMTTEEVAQLRAQDVYSCLGIDCTVAESGKYLEEWYRDNARWNYQGGVKGKFWEKVGEVVDILKNSNEWPFEPIEVSRDKTRLYDGHHRSNAAILAGWDKPIPVEVWGF
ncbi:ParB-like nuclease domain protein [Mycobacterium phage Kerberos]|uniref:ParB-like nuclease n=1 Tax=Mycobacterium phage Chy5 TaxID=1327948 RepID=UPI00032B4905|nr:ParB-like nuclease [Mycobacterium phage Chy5]APC43137.1 ParB-like nuclease domain protein [Mycobacterium phage Kerberos]APC46205.1 ParB-like nuclease domain protein [Mycobacterium phage StarStuff]AXH48950.1 ParB-like nuclease domain protein [Mycobacterium phage Tomathan]QBP28747.1 ParB-like nuclease domain protein [Mycobacterium phage DBQu4n]UXE05503.1 ParB-like nuclease domain protein [Mycobacterium phage Duplo]